MAQTCKNCGREIVKDSFGIWKDVTGRLFPYHCDTITWPVHKPEKKKAKCEKCGREIIKDPSGLWKASTPILPYYCSNWSLHKPEKKKAKCKYCGRSITKKGKKWKDDKGIFPTECWNDIQNLDRKHKPAK